MPPCKDRDFCNSSVAEHEKRLHVTSIFFFVSDVITINYTRFLICAAAID